MPDDPCYPPAMALPGSGPVVLDAVPALRVHAAQNPDRTAVRDGTSSLSYADLLSRADAWAAALVGRGVAPGDRVGIHLPQSAEYIAVILGCLTAGAVFVPIPFTDPEERIRRIARDCAVTLTVVPAGHRLSEAARGALAPMGLDALDAAPGTPPDREPSLDAGDVVYLVYTSGTTGQPKGVMIRRESLRNFVANTVERFELGSATRALCVSPFHFDGAFGSVFAVLAVGGTLVVADRSPLLPGDFFRLLLDEQITHTSFSPSLLRLLTASRDLPLLAHSRLRTLGLGGEDCTPEQIIRLLDHRPELRVFNRYGPTETTVVVATHLVTRQWCESGRKIPLGVPDPGAVFHLVDEEGQLITAPRTAGELCVAGVQVMEGYWGAPEASRQVLRDDLVPGCTVYRTGDVVERTEDGLYVYLDRADNVVKRHGNRVSMTELTEALLAVPGVEDAVALVDHRAPGASSAPRVRGESPLIRAFVVAPHMDAAAVRSQLLKRVPAYMNPDSCQVIAELPRLSGGKPDTRRLRELA